MFLLMIGVAIATPSMPRGGINDVTSELECDTGKVFEAEPLLTACTQADGVGERICLATCDQKPDYLEVVKCIQTCLEPAPADPVMFVIK